MSGTPNFIEIIMGPNTIQQNNTREGLTLIYETYCVVYLRWTVVPFVVPSKSGVQREQIKPGADRLESSHISQLENYTSVNILL